MTVAAPQAGDFFASRAGVCVYVKVHGAKAVRVQFATVDALGVADSQARGVAEEAVRVARAALDEHRAELLPLFELVARSTT